MVFFLETAMSSRLVLFTILVQIACGTYFPPVSNPPPIPAPAVSNFNNASPGFYRQGDLPQDIPVVRAEGLFPPDTKVDDQRWYLQENQSDGGQYTRSTETFDRNYQNGEPFIGPVATPIPDDAYSAQSSSITRLNQNDAGNSEVWILTSGSENQYIPQRWIQMQVPSERVVEVVNQGSGPPAVATDQVKSVIAPEVPVKSQFTANSPPNVVQVWVQAPKSVDSAAYGKSAIIVDDTPSVKQIIDIPPTNGKQIVQQVNKAAPSVVSNPATVLNIKSFSVPPPLPPPLKGSVASKSIPPVNVIPDSNVIIGGKNSVYQRLRHVWIPTSSRTGKFLTFPVQASIDSGKSVVNSDISLAPTPITVSDTWVLKQDGLLTGFEQQKSGLPPPSIQSGKTIIQNPPVVQINNPQSPKIVAQVYSPQSQTAKALITNDPINIWPIRKDSNTKISGKSVLVTPDVSVSSLKSDAISINNGFPLPPVVQQKTLTKSAIPPPVPPPPSLQIINGKPCPLPPSPVSQKSLFPSPSPPVISVPRVIGTSRLPVTRIIRVNRYPTGNYYLLNTRMRPNYLTYPNSAVIQQTKAGLVRIVQPNQIPLQIQGKQPIVSPQAKRIVIPVQSKQFVPPVPARQMAFPFVARQAILTLPPKSTRILYPTVQAIRNPWSGLSNYLPIPGKGILFPQLGALKVSPASKSDSSSSSNSNSSESSSSESEDKKEEKPKKEEKAKEEEKPKEEKEERSESEETSSSNEEKEATSGEKESEESPSESKTEEESIEAAESQVLHAPANRAILPNFAQVFNQESGIRVTTIYSHKYPDEFHSEPHREIDLKTESHGSTDANFLPNHPIRKQSETHGGLQGSPTDNFTTQFNRD